MTPIRYLNNRFQEVALETSKSGGRPALGAEADAIQFVFGLFRVLMAAPFVFKLIIHFAAVNLRLKPAPKPELDLLQAQANQAQLEKHRKMGKKIGMQTGTKIGGSSDALN